MNAENLQKIINFLLDIVAPRNPIIADIENRRTTCFREFLSRGGMHEGTIFLLPYREPIVKTALVEIKNHPNKKVAHVLGELLFEGVMDVLKKSLNLNLVIKEPVLILPIPITTAKKRKRGWNQCELILDGFEKAMEKITKPEQRFEPRFAPRKEILVKPRENADQVGRSRSQRFENLKNCFAVAYSDVDLSPVKNRTIIVFDDIVTTGATLNDAERALLSAGANKVIRVAIAH